MNLRWLLAVSAAVVCLAGGPAFGGPLRDYNHFVIIYEENHSFDNLYGLWGDVNGEPVNGLAAAAPNHTLQVRADGTTPYQCLLQRDVNLASPVPLPTKCTDTTGDAFVSAFENKPFQIDAFIAPADKTCPRPGTWSENGFRKGTGIPGGCTRDLIQRFYIHRYQINGGKLDRFVTGSDAAGLAMGYYDTKQLPIYKYLHGDNAPNYVIADAFFQAAYGGSFLNHQWLVAAQTPLFVNALNNGGKFDLHTVVDANGMPESTPLYKNLLDEPKAMPLTASCKPPEIRPPTPKGMVCGDRAVNTIQPMYQPFRPGTAIQKRLPPLHNPTIGDLLSGARINWAWYSGGWSNANGDIDDPGWTNGNGPQCSDRDADDRATFPHCPDKSFQYHHQPFNYFANFAPGTAMRTEHLLDEAEFFEAAREGALKAVSFVKPLGVENEHPGYASVSAGNSHLVDLIRAVMDGPNGADTLIVVTYDEFGGQWDHVPPPPFNDEIESAFDDWGPGTRIPAVLISKRFGKSAVDHKAYDTTSILRMIEERFGLDPVSLRDETVRSLADSLAAGG